METLFLVVVILMLALAVFDLAVGVSNDAVNFLTSAIGSRAATLKTIMIVASIGILVGAVASGGMMEVAKKVMFNPAMFSFQDLIFIYIVVMLTDVLLLDLFNTLKLPTSTTVSIVFELLGASLAITVLKVYTADGSISDIFEYINAAKAIKVIVAIFVSVGLAFTGGWLVQYLLRALVTFDYRKHLRIGGPIFGAVSIVVVMNFILTKGLKHSPLKHSAFVETIAANALPVFGLLFVAGYVYFFIRTRDKDYDPFRTITLFGTFALAMAFASNDLVNFIGVPVAGLEAFQLWSGSGTAPTDFMMTPFVGEGGPANLLLLGLAGAIMIVVLLRSEKAKNVMSTAMNLSRQGPGLEQFWGNDMSRAVVRVAGYAAKGVRYMVPASVRQTIERRYTIARPVTHSSDGTAPPAFDLVRASANLMVAATVITLGTTYKLPLSTTYVTFMVLMGTSLADRAWNRDSAVYRVSGVLAVVGGWFGTAVTAMLTTIVFASIVFFNGFVGIGIVAAIVVTGLVIINRNSAGDDEDETPETLPADWANRSVSDVKEELHERVHKINKKYVDEVRRLIDAIVAEKGKPIRKLDKKIKRRLEENTTRRASITSQMRDAGISQLETGKALFEFYARENQLLRELEDAIAAAKIHVLNMHHPIGEDQAEYLRTYAQLIEDYGAAIDSTEENKAYLIDQRLAAVSEHVDKAVYHHIEGLARDHYSFQNSQLFLGTFIRHVNASNVIHRMYETTK